MTGLTAAPLTWMEVTPLASGLGVYSLLTPRSGTRIRRLKFLAVLGFTVMATFPFQGYSDLDGGNSVGLGFGSIQLAHSSIGHADSQAEVLGGLGIHRDGHVPLPGIFRSGWR